MKKTIAIILTLVLLFSALSLSAYAAGTDTAGTGSGRSADDPLIVNNYADLKAALETDDTLYIRVDSFKNTTGLDYYSLEEDIDYKDASSAITQSGTKYLEVNTDISCRTTSLNCKLYAFIMCYGNLYISGNGSINVSFNAYFMNAIIHVRDPGELMVNGNITFDPESKAVDAHGRSVFLESGKITLNSGTYKGFGSHNEAKQNGAQAVYIYRDNSCYATINGGLYYSTYGGKNYGLYNENDRTVLNGGIFHGIYNHSNFTSKKLSGILGTNRKYKDVSTDTAFDGSAIYSTEKTLEVISVGYSYKLSGTVTGFLDSKGMTMIKLERASLGGSSNEVVEKAVYGNGAYQFTGLTPNGLYRLTVSKANHVTRTYSVIPTSVTTTQDVKIHPIGDISGDGKVSTKDFGMAYAHAQKLPNCELTDYKLKCADVVKNDGKVTTTDAARINAHVQKTDYLW